VTVTNLPQWINRYVFTPLGWYCTEQC